MARVDELINLNGVKNASKGWGIYRLKDVAAINPMTVMPTSTDVDFFPMLSINIDGGMESRERKPVSQSSGYSTIRSNDVVFAKVTPCFENGKSSIVPELTTGVGLATTEITCLRPTSRVKAEFLHYRIKGIDFHNMGINEMKGAGGLKRVPDRCTADFAFSLPSSTEQVAIANYLDEATAAIDEQKALLGKKKELILEQKKALIHKVVTKGLDDSVAIKPSGVDWIGDVPVGWEVRRVEKLASVTAGYPFDSSKFGFDGFPIIRIRDLQGGELDTRYCGDWVESASTHNGDILVGMDGDFTVCKWMKGAALLNQRLCKVEFKGIDKEYAKYGLQFSMDEINSFANATTVKHLSMGDVRKSTLPFPPIPEQVAIANYLDEATAAIDEQCELIEKKIALLTEMRASVIHDAVTKGIPAAR